MVYYCVVLDIKQELKTCLEDWFWLSNSIQIRLGNLFELKQLILIDSFFFIGIGLNFCELSNVISMYLDVSTFSHYLIGECVVFELDISFLFHSMMIGICPMVIVLFIVLGGSNFNLIRIPYFACSKLSCHGDLIRFFCLYGLVICDKLVADFIYINQRTDGSLIHIVDQINLGTIDVFVL